MNVHYRLKITKSLIASTLLAVSLTGCASLHGPYQKGSTAELNRDYETALGEYKEALEKHPDNIDYRMKYEKTRIEAAFDHFEKGRRAYANNELDAAKKDLTRSLELDPTNDMVKELLERIKAIEASDDRNQPEPERSVQDMKDDSRTDPSFQSQMEPTITVPISQFKSSQDSKVIFESLAEIAGFNVIFDPDFRGTPIPVELNGVDIYQALDIVCMQTNPPAFWQPINKTTILVSTDNQTKRRQYEQQILKTVYLSNAVTATEITEAITALRTILNMRYIAQITAMNAIILRDTPDKVAIAEMILNDVDKSKPEVNRGSHRRFSEVDRDQMLNLGISPPTSIGTTFEWTPLQTINNP